MSWRDNSLARDALAIQGYYDDEARLLLQDTLAGALRDLWVKNPVRTSSEDILTKKTILGQAGLTRFEILDKILPGFRGKHELSDDELRQLKTNPKEYPDLEERDKAIREVSNLLWGTMCKTSRAGAVQELVVQKGLLLIEARLTRDGVQATVKAATDDHDLIIEYYVRPRGDQLVKVSGGVRDDCTMVGMAFDGITDRMKRELGGHVTTAIGRLMQVASPDFVALGSPAETRKRAIGPSNSKS
ncbi:MAG: hypothetical protein M3Y48_10485 [Actinomycetota bacterium]|nr:hypothetical protein [Actinomycetota bacterium]